MGIAWVTSPNNYLEFIGNLRKDQRSISRSSDTKKPDPTEDLASLSNV